MSIWLHGLREIASFQFILTDPCVRWMFRFHSRLQETAFVSEKLYKLCHANDQEVSSAETVTYFLIQIYLIRLKIKLNPNKNTGLKVM